MRYEVTKSHCQCGVLLQGLGDRAGEGDGSYVAPAGPPAGVRELLVVFGATGSER